MLILGKFDDLLSIHVDFVPKCGEEVKINADLSHKKIVTSILRFLLQLLKVGRRRKYFQSFEVSTYTAKQSLFS